MPDIVLGSNERLLLRCHATVNAYRPWRPLGDGRFWLTNERLEWKRDRIYSPLPQPGRIVLPLTDILEVTASTALWGVYGTLVVDTATRRYIFRPWRWSLYSALSITGPLCRGIAKLIKEHQT